MKKPETKKQKAERLAAQKALVERAIAFHGSQQKLADAINTMRSDNRITRQTEIARWKSGRQIHPLDAPWIHISTKGEVSVEDMYPGLRSLLIECKPRRLRKVA